MGRRAVAAITCLALAGCTAPASEPRILSVTPNIFREHHAGRADIATQGLGFHPDFDLDRGTGFAGSVTALLEPGHRVLPTTMPSPDRLVAIVPETVTQGQYDLVVETNDGRSARMRNAIGVAPGELVIETISSNVVYVPPPVAGVDVPIWVNVRNNTACTLNHLNVILKVTREGDEAQTDLTSREISWWPRFGTIELPVTRPCDPEVGDCDPPVVITFAAEPTDSAMAGPVIVDANATAERGSELGCEGTVNAPFALTRLRLYLMTRTSADIQVEQLRVYPDQLQLISHGINLTFRLRNTSSQPVTIDTLTLSANPNILASTDPPEINPRVIPAGGDAAYQLSGMLLENLRARQVVVLTVGATGHDETGVYHTTRPADQSTTVTIHD